MNKFLRYSLSLVLAFVASVTFAGTTPYKVLTFPDEGTEGKEINGYDKTWKATIGEDVGLLRISIHTSGMVGNSSNAEERKSHLLLPSLHLLLISQSAILS